MIKDLIADMKMAFKS